MSYPRNELVPSSAEQQLAALKSLYEMGGAASHWYPPEEQEPSVPLAHYLWVLKSNRWRIAALVATAVIATFIISSRIVPMYESTATVDVDRRMPSGIVGQDSMQAPTPDADQFLATQVKLIQSDSVLRPVAQRFKLKTDDGEDAGKRPAYAGEAPVSLKGLKINRPPNTYLLQISYRSPDPQLAADVANAVAQSYIEHTFTIRFRASAGLSKFMEKQLEELKTKMERSGGALARFERELNLVNPEEKVNILSSRLLQLNTEYTNAQSDRVRREAAFTSVRTGSFDAAQASTQGDALKKLGERLSQAKEAFAQVKSSFGVNHPEYRKYATQIAELQQQLDESAKGIRRSVEIEYQQAVNREGLIKRELVATKAEADRLNARSVEYQSLKREADADKKLYEELTTKIKEAGINAGFQSNSIRLADAARPALRPVSPNIKLNLALALILSTLLAVGGAVFLDVLDSTIRDPEQARRILNTEVVGSLPRVREWRRKKLVVQSEPGPKSTALVPASNTVVLRHDTPDAFTEAVRTLRNSILLGNFGRPLKSILMTSAAPREGKTTTAIHLAIANAEQKRRTLLIDADVRRPGVSKSLGLESAAGLASALAEGSRWRDHLVRLHDLPHLDVLPAGDGDSSIADLIGPSLAKLVAQAEKEYDLVIVDAPPLLGFPEPLQIAASVDGVVLVSLAGQTDRKAVGSVLAMLQRVRANVIGLVLNDVRSDMADGYYAHYGYYGKYGYHGRKRSA